MSSLYPVSLQILGRCHKATNALVCFHTKAGSYLIVDLHIPLCFRLWG